MSKAQLQVIAPGVYVWIGAGGDSNSGAVETPDGPIVIDSQQSRALGEQFRDALKVSIGAPVREVVNTHFHLDHVAGNVAFAGLPIISHKKTQQLLERELGVMGLRGVEVSDTMTKIRMFFGSNFEGLVPEGERQWFIDRVGGSKPLTILGPTETFMDRLDVELPTDRLCLEYWGPGHCDGDLVIRLEKARVIFMGDLFFHGRFPWFGDCDLNGWIDVLDRIRKMDIKTVVPGHGLPATLKELGQFRDLLVAVRGAADRAIKSGWSEDAAARDIMLDDYISMQRYKEWMPFNIRAAYRYLHG